MSLVKEYLKELREIGYVPKHVQPARGSGTLEDLLKHTWPVSPEEAEAFVASIYADRREAERDELPDCHESSSTQT
jgi:hypothetical protein